MSEENLKICIVRHGESVSNEQNRFAGIKNVPLTDKGRNQAALAGIMLGQADIKIDRVFTSKLDRAIETADIFLSKASQANHRPIRDERMNERDYGVLTDCVKNDPAVIEKHGEAILKSRRGYYDRPPEGESLHDVVVNRASPFAEEHIRPWFICNQNNQDQESSGNRNELMPDQDAGVQNSKVSEIFNQSPDAKFEDVKNVLIVAHGNSLRALLVTLGIETIETIPNIEFETGVPEVLEFDKKGSFLKRYKLEPAAEPAAEPSPSAIN